ncbi:MAG: hypothetical protein WCF24_03495, partial [Acidimicrobiales bacterium]
AGPAPSLVTFRSRDVAAPMPPAPPPDGSLRLLIKRALFDRGTLSEASPSFTRLVGPPVLAVHPDTLAEIGVESGSEVLVRSEAGVITVPIAHDSSLSRHIGAITANLEVPGEPLERSLVDARLETNDIRVERI